MSSFYATKGDHTWRDPDICDILSPQPDSQYNSGGYSNTPETSQGFSSETHENYVIPGFDPSNVLPPEINGTLQWSSPEEGVYFEGDGSVKPPPQYYGSLNHHQGYNNDTELKTESLSSGASGNGQKVGMPPAVPGSGASSERQKEVSKPKRSRGKVLNDEEAELMEIDDSLLTEDQLTIKRKAQNRLAQRAFRERKESKLKELEARLLESEGERQRLLEALDEIKSQFISVRTENEVLRSTNSGRQGEMDSQSSRFTFPQSQQAFVQEMMSGQSHHVVDEQTVSKIYEEPQRPGQKVLAVGAVWDYLSVKIEEEEYENIDMVEVMQTLKGNEVCHGYGPAYPLSVVNRALDTVAERHHS